MGRWHLLPGRLEDDAQCILVIIGATPEGKKELVALADGVRESALSWKELLLDLKRHGLDLKDQRSEGVRLGVGGPTCREADDEP